MLTLLPSCAREVVAIQAKGVARLGPDVSGHVYFYTNGIWVLSKNKVHLPEGWYAHSYDGDK